MGLGVSISENPLQHPGQGCDRKDADPDQIGAVCAACFGSLFDIACFMIV